MVGQRSPRASSARPALYACPNEGLPDTVVANLEVRGDCCEGHTAAIEVSRFSNLLSTERLTTELDTLIAQQFQQAALREGVLHAEGWGCRAGPILRNDLSDESRIEPTAQESGRRL
jgi:hypothetical protein